MSLWHRWKRHWQVDNSVSFQGPLYKDKAVLVCIMLLCAAPWTFVCRYKKDTDRCSVWSENEWYSGMTSELGRASSNMISGAKIGVKTGKRFYLGTCESAVSVRIESRINRALRFEFKLNIRIEYFQLQRMLIIKISNYKWSKRDVQNYIFLITILNNIKLPAYEHSELASL